VTGQPWTTKLMEGDPIQVGQRQLIPVVKVRSIIRRQVTFGTASSGGGGGGLVWLQPVAVIERWSDGSEECIAIPDETWTAIKSMLIGALALPIIYVVVASLAFVWRKSRQ
jgi:uncharacterized spore protein YtfJ